MKARPLFENRRDAGKQLAAKLATYKCDSMVILAIPRGGVPMGVELASALNADLDFVISRKIPIPLQPEAGFGAIADDGTVVLNEALTRKLGLTPQQIEYEASRVRLEIKRRAALYRGDRPLMRVTGKTVIITDDGLASGYTMIAAIESIQHRRPREIIVAIPVASTSALEEVSKVVKNVVTIATGSTPFAVADYYRHWYDLNDEEVMRNLEQWRKKKWLST
jgi:putative phosphoribosyl transferase